MKLLVLALTVLTALATWWHSARQEPRKPLTQRLLRSAVAGAVFYFLAMSLLVIGATRG